MQYTVVCANEHSVFDVGQVITDKVNYLIQTGYIPYGNLVVVENFNNINAMQAMVRYDEEDLLGLTPYLGNMEEKLTH